MSELIVRIRGEALKQIKKLGRGRTVAETVRDALRVYRTLRDFKQPDGSIIIHKKCWCGLRTKRYKVWLP